MHSEGVRDGCGPGRHALTEPILKLHVALIFRRELLKVGLLSVAVRF